MQPRALTPVSRSVALAFAAVAALAAAPATAHETLHDVQRGKAIAVRAYSADGEAMAYTECEVYSPADPKVPYQKCRTDRNGWVAFVPDAPGKWRVKVVEHDGHGLDVLIEAGGEQGSPAARDSSAGALSSAAFALRPLVGLVAVGAVFVALYFTYRRKRGTPP